MRTYGLGHLFDTPARRLLRLNAARLLGTSPAAPSSASLEAFECPVLDQGYSSACGGHGTTQLVYTAFGAAGKPLSFVPSPWLTYGVVRSLERGAVTPRGGELPPLSDSGIMPSDLLPALADFGIKPMTRTPTPDGRRSDVWTDDDVRGIPGVRGNVNDEVDVADLIASGQKIISGEYRIDEHAPNMVEQVKAAIAGSGSGQSHGCPVGIGAFVDSAVMSWMANSAPLSHVNLGDARGGGHWFAITSYRFDSALNRSVFRCVNSWGSTYGDTGHFEVTEDWLRAQLSYSLDLYPFHIA